MGTETTSESRYSKPRFHGTSSQARPGLQRPTHDLWVFKSAIASHFESPKNADIPESRCWGEGILPTQPSSFRRRSAESLTTMRPLRTSHLRRGRRQPHNVFVHLAWLQEKLGEPKRVNALLVRNDYDQTNPVSFPSRLDQSLKSFLTLSDWGLMVRHTPKSRTERDSGCPRSQQRRRDSAERMAWPARTGGRRSRRC